MELRNRSIIKQPQKDFVMPAGMNTTSLYEPSTYTEAVKCERKENWEQALENEINLLNENETWFLQNLPIRKKPIQSKWVFKIKTNPDGSQKDMKQDW